MSVSLIVGALLALVAAAYVLCPLFAPDDKSSAESPAAIGDACPVCGAPVAATARFCSACGQRVHGAMP